MLGDLLLRANQNDLDSGQLGGQKCSLNYDSRCTVTSHCVNGYSDEVRVSHGVGHTFMYFRARFNEYRRHRFT